ncbi:beta strand repeat-containing protein [Parasphingorhabdus sp.]|uniref:beta strand repeat-containing protein n=1 Tax=Parasphingorhabdus sp. TaxID=2709688 RepID=UPI003D2E882D
MTTTATIWLEEFVTNLITADAQSAPRVVSLANGNFLVVWVDDNQTAADGFGTDIVGVIFDPLGNPISDSLYLNFPFGFSREEDQVDIAATPDGGFVAVYRFPSGDDTDILFGRYDETGTRTAQDFIVSDSSDAVVYTNPSVAVADDGSFFVTYEYTNGAVNDIRGVKVSAADVVGTEQILRADGFSNGANLEDTEDPHTVLLTNGNFATVYSENDNNGGSNERTIEVRISNADGTNLSLINNVTAPDALPDSDPRIAALPDGRFVVMWREGGNHNGRIFNNDGSQSVAEFTISNNSGLDFDGAEIIGLEDSSFAVALIDETQGRLFIIRYNDNTPDGGSRIVSTDAAGTGGNITNLSMDLTGDGRILLSWENGEIYTEILDPRDAGAFSAEVDDGATTDRQGQSTTITGTTSADTIYGLDGNDTLIGNGGDDILVGGTGEDMLDGGGDIDMVSYAGSSGGVTVDLESNSVSGGDAAGDTIVNFENVSGSDHNDILTGSDISNELFGGAGDDLLRGGDGGDLLDGGADFDTVSYTGSNLPVFVRLFNQTAFGGHANDDTLVSIEGVIGSSKNDDIIGSNIANILDGGDGDDIIMGFNGADTIHGGNGNDLIIGGAGGDNLDGSTDIDTLSYAGSTLGVFVRLFNNSVFGGDANGDTIANFENVIGSSNNDDIIGSNQANMLDGGDGDDTINGFVGDDIIIGGAGGDNLDGGDGIDTLSYAGSASSLGVFVRLFNNSVFGGDANGDTIANFENATGSSNNDDLIGSVGANILDGGAGADTINGFVGDDTIIGGAGDDLIIGGAGADNLDGGADIDTVSYAGSLLGVFVRLFNNSVFGGDANGDTIVNFENAIGSSNNDDIIGSNQANMLDGGDGDDTINGFVGDDIIIGGAGNDLVIGGAGGDNLDGGADIDTVSYAGSTLGVFVRLFNNSVFGGDANGDTIVNFENATGSSNNDDLIGSNQANTLDGGAGADKLNGFVGDDILIGGAGDDLFVFTGISGSDTITDFTAGAGSEDKIDLQDSVFTDLNDVLVNTVDDGLGNTVISKSGVSISLNGVTKAQLHEDDFVFATGMSIPVGVSMPDHLPILDMDMIHDGWLM